MNILTPLITLPLVVKAIGNNGMGRIAIVSSILSYFSILGSTGLTSYGNKIIAKNNNKQDLTKSFNSVLNLQLLYTTISITAFLIYATLLGFNLKNILLIAMLQIFASYFDFTWFFYGLNQIKTIAIRNFIIKISGIILIYFFVRKPEDIYNYFLILGVTNLLANLSVFSFIMKKIDFKSLRFTFSVPKAELISSLFILLPLFIMALYSNIDRFIILNFLKNFDKVGIYDVGMKFISMFAVLIVSLRPLMISKISTNNENKDKVQELVYKSICLVFYISIPICLLLFTNIETFISLFLGEKFIESAFVIKIMSIQILLTGIGDVFVNQILISIGQEKKVLSVMCFLCFLLIVLYVVLVPIFGIYGAALSSVIAHFLILFLEFYFVNKFIKIRINIKEILKIFAAGTFSGIILIGFYFFFSIRTYVDLVIITIIGVLAYVGLCFVLKLKLQNSIFELLFRYKKV
jgi:O-antigen/teichoic acid export membrane protein